MLAQRELRGALASQYLIRVDAKHSSTMGAQRTNIEDEIFEQTFRRRCPFDEGRLAQVLACLKSQFAREFPYRKYIFNVMEIPTAM